MPQPADTAWFPLAGYSQVTFGVSPQTTTLAVADGNVVFLLGGHTYTVTNPSSVWPFSINVGDAEDVYTARLTLDNGTLAGRYAVIGAITHSGGTVVVGPDATWTNTGSLYLGYGGTGVLNVQNGGVLTSQHGRIGLLPGSMGEAIVTGAGSAWETGDLSVGGSATASGSPGTLTVGGGGRVSASGTLKVWLPGTVTLKAGGRIAIQAFDLSGGTFNWAAGTLQFTNDLLVGPGQPFGSSVTVGSGRYLEVGGTLTVEPGGTVTLDGGSIATQAFTEAGTFNHHDGTFYVLGGTYNPGTSDLTVDGNTPAALPHLVLDGVTSELFFGLRIGDDAKGALTVSGGTVLDCGGWFGGSAGERYIGYAAGSDGTVTVDGLDSQLTTGDARLYVG